MKLKKILIVFLVVIVNICFASIAVKTTGTRESSELVDAAIDILTSCYGDRGPIGIAGSLPRNFLDKLWSRKKIPVVMVNNSKRTKTQTWDTLRTKLRVFFLIASTQSEYFDGFYHIWRSNSYDPSASILVLSSMPKQKNACAGVPDQLIRLRYNGAFNTNVLCRHSTKQILIIGFNPHTQWAPPPWQPIRNYKSTATLTFFPYLRLYQSGNDACYNLDYDKTKDLGGNIINIYTTKGYKFARSFYLRVTGRPDIDKIISRMQIDRLQQANIWAMFFRWSNAIPKIYLLPNDNEEPLPNRGVKIFAEIFEVRDAPDFRTIIPPVLQYKNRILTQFRGYKSQVRKLVTVVDTYSQFSIGFALLTTLIFFKIFSRQRFSSGMLNVIRMVCNAGFTNVPTNLASRTYLACLFLFVVTIHGIFAGNLASLLTSEIPVRHARTIEDLHNFNYTIYTDESLFILLNRTKYRDRIVVHKNYAMVGCRIVLSNPSIACIDNTNYLMDMAALTNLYISNTDIFVEYATFYVAPQIPYAEILSKIILRSFEADIMYLLPVRVKKNLLDGYQNYVQNRKIPARAITLNDLSFAFIVLGTGLICAIISFIIEVAFNRIHLKKAKVRRFV